MTDSTDSADTSLFGPAHDTAAGIPAYQYARIQLVPPPAADTAVVIIHVSPSSVRSSIAEKINAELKSDLDDHGLFHVVTADLNEDALKVMSTLAPMLKPVLAKRAEHVGPAYWMATSTLLTRRATTVSTDFSPAICSLATEQPEIYQALTHPGEDASLLEKAKHKAAVAATTALAHATAANSEKMAASAESAGIYVLNNQRSEKDEHYDQLLADQARATADELFVLGDEHPDDALVIYTNQARIAETIVTAYREADYDVSTELTQAPGSVAYLQTDMVQPMLRTTENTSTMTIQDLLAMMD